MAIKPSDLLKPSKEDEEALVALEKVIDDFLSANFQPNEYIKIAVSKLDEKFNNPRRMKMLQARYKDAGWSVKEVIGGNGALFLEFCELGSEPKSPEEMPTARPDVESRLAALQQSLNKTTRIDSPYK